MDNYFAYWKRGWWAWLLSLCLSFILFPLFGLAAVVFFESSTNYVLACLVLWLFIGAPLWGWLFEVFARHSERIGGKPDEPADTRMLAAASEFAKPNASDVISPDPGQQT